MPMLCWLREPEIEQPPEPETEAEKREPEPAEPEVLQLLAFAICVGDDITPGMRSTVKTTNTAPIENANLCIWLVYKAIIYPYCKIIPKILTYLLHLIQNHRP